MYEYIQLKKHLPSEPQLEALLLDVSTMLELEDPTRLEPLSPTGLESL